MRICVRHSLGIPFVFLISQLNTRNEMYIYYLRIDQELYFHWDKSKKSIRHWIPHRPTRSFERNPFDNLNTRWNHFTAERGKDKVVGNANRQYSLSFGMLWQVVQHDRYVEVDIMNLWQFLSNTHLLHSISASVETRYGGREPQGWVDIWFWPREVTCLRCVQFRVSGVQLPLGESIYRAMPV